MATGFALAMVWPGAIVIIVLADIGWVAALLWDVWKLLPRQGGRITVEMDLPPAFTVGRSQPVVHHWSSSFPYSVALQVRSTDPEPFRTARLLERRLVISGNSRTDETLSMTPNQRGWADQSVLHIRIPGYLGLVSRQEQLTVKWNKVVYPSILSSDSKNLSDSRPPKLEHGKVTARQRGEGRTFESLREWVPGEDSRAIDWKATARRRKLMVRQYESERRQRIMLMVDCGRLLTAEIDQGDRLDHAVRAAMLLARSAVANDDDVGLLAFADQVLAFIPPRRGKKALRQVNTALATLQGRLVESDYPGAFIHLMSRERKRMLVVLFTDLIDRMASAAILAYGAALRPQHLPLAVLLRDDRLERVAATRPVGISTAFERAAAEELLLARAAGIAGLRADGVMVLDAAPGAAADLVVAQYRHFKRRGVI